MKIDNHALQMFRGCHQKYYNRIVRGLIRNDVRESTPLSFGQWIHTALELYYRNGMTEVAAEKGQNEFMLGYKEDPADDKRTMLKGLEILNKYFKRYESEPFEVVDVEVGAMCPLSEEHIYTGRLDLIVEWKETGGIWVIDHKTSSSVDSLVGKPNNQLSGYIWLITEMYENVMGGMFNVLGVYKTDKQKDKGTGKMVDREIFRRVLTERRKEELDEWKKGVLHTIKEIEACEKEGCWVQDSNKCMDFKRACEYIEICRCPSEKVREGLRQSEMFRVEEWKAFEGAVEEVG